MSLGITTNRDGDALEIVLSGRLDTNTAPELDSAFKQNLYGATSLALDLGGLEYVSSAGLRVILAGFKAMAKQGTMVVRNLGEPVRGVFEVTGLLDIIAVE